MFLLYDEKIIFFVCTYKYISVYLNKNVTAILKLNDFVLMCATVHKHLSLSVVKKLVLHKTSNRTQF